MKNLIVLFALTFFFGESLWAQGVIDDEDRIFFRNEISYGFAIKSNGWGAGYRYGKRIDARNKWLFEGDFNYIKHEKEKKQFNYYGTSFTRFVYGKTNAAFNIRFGVGRQREIIEKFDKSSISIRFVWNAGVSAAFLKPIYYKILENDRFVTKKYEEGIPVFYIWERSPFYKGLAETRIVPGGFAKAGISVDFSKTDQALRVLETGLFLEAYPRRIEIMANETNRFLLPGIYFSYRFGKVVSGYHIEE